MVINELSTSSDYEALDAESLIDLCSQAHSGPEYAHALSRLGSLSQREFDQLFEIWLVTRSCQIEVSLSQLEKAPSPGHRAELVWSLKRNARIDLEAITSSTVDSLLNAIFDLDEEIAERAAKLLESFDELELGRAKERTRVLLLDCLQEKNYDKISSLAGGTIDLLLEIASSSHGSPESTRARLYLGQHPPAREALCQQAIFHGNEIALEIINSVDLFPSDPAQRAVLYVMCKDFSRLAQIEKVSQLISGLVPKLSVHVLRQLIVNLANATWTERFNCLAELLCRAESSGAVRAILHEVQSDSLCHEFCREWLESSSKEMGDALRILGWVAQAPVESRYLSALNADRVKVLLEDEDRSAPILLQEYSNNALGLKTRALTALAEYSAPSVLNHIAGHWYVTFDPQLEQIISRKSFIATGATELRIATALLVNEDSAINELAEEAVGCLLKHAFGAGDHPLKQKALSFLRTKPNQLMINSLWRRCRELKDRQLFDLLQTAKHIATEPPLLNLLTRLLAEDSALPAEVTRAETVQLFEWLNSSNEVVKGRVEALLLKVKQPEAIDVVCDRALAGVPIAVGIVRAAGFVPSQKTARALFFARMEDWASYDREDPSGSYLAEAYSKADPSNRLRIIESLQRSNRSRQLQLVLLQKLKHQRNELSLAEWQDLLPVLRDQEDWGELWRLVEHAPATIAAELVRTLSLVGWKPEATELARYNRLVAAIRECPRRHTFQGRPRLLPSLLSVANCMVAVDPAGTLLAIAEGDSVEIRTVPDMVRVGSVSVSKSKIMLMQFVEPDNTLVCICDDGLLAAVDTKTLSLKCSKQEPPRYVSMVSAWRSVLCLRTDGAIDARSSQDLSWQFEIRRDQEVSALAVSEDNRWLALGGRTIDIVDLKDRSTLVSQAVPQSPDAMVIHDGCAVAAWASAEIGLLNFVRSSPELDGNLRTLGQTGKISSIKPLTSTSVVALNTEGELCEFETPALKPVGRLCRVRSPGTLAASKNGNTLVCAGPSELLVWSNVTAVLASLPGKSVTPSQIQILEELKAQLSPEEVAWANLIRALGEVRHEHDIELASSWDEDDENYEVELV
ncbi:MAG: hypothetical protein K2W95_18545 [Candidatus Obscuribacterales bacterium]|nr:hypothetical protein [Candidatus Obscuribacterales bacterium]